MSHAKLLALVSTVLVVVICNTSALSQTHSWKILSATNGERTVAIDVYRGNPDTIYAIGDSIVRSTDRGADWETLQGRDWGTGSGNLKVDPTDSKVLYLSRNSTIRLESNEHWMSTDGGYNWRWLYVDGIYLVDVIEIDPSDPKTVYIGVGPSQFVRTTDRGQSWDTLLIPALDPTSLAISPTNDSILYAGFYSGGVYKSTDKGKSWSQLPFVSPQQSGPRLILNPRNPNVIYATILGYDYSQPRGVFKSTDGGITWIEKNAGLGQGSREVYSIRLNPRNPDDMFIGVNSTDSSGRMMFRSTNGGDAWFSISNGFPVGNGDVGAIAIDTLHDRIDAGVNTWPNDQGIYVLDLLSTTTSVNESSTAVPKEFSLSQNYPNPFNPSTSISFGVPKQTHVRLQVYNVLGQLIETLTDEDKHPGTYTATWEATARSSGLYFYRISAGEFVQTKKATLLK